MVCVQPFSAWRPPENCVHQTIAPPYDVVDVRTAKHLAADNPKSFLHLSKPEIDCIQQADERSLEKRAKQNLDTFIQQQYVIRDPENAFYVYRMESLLGEQTGFACLISLEETNRTAIKMHEAIREKQVQSRKRLLEVQQAQLSPILLAYPDEQRLADLVQTICEIPPTYQGIPLNQVAYSLWRVDDQRLIREIASIFSAIPSLYLADGHHRTQAAIEMAQANPRYQQLLAVVFPASTLNILGYHRICTLNHLDTASFMQQLKAITSLQPKVAGYLPQQPHEYGLCINKQWYAFALTPEKNDLLSSLETSVLHDQIIEPLLGIRDLRHDPHIRFVGGLDSIQHIEMALAEDPNAIAFTCYPTTMAQCMGVADQALTMPPKSTWFEPKLADGLLAYPYEGI